MTWIRSIERAIDRLERTVERKESILNRNIALAEELDEKILNTKNDTTEMNKKIYEIIDQHLKLKIKINAIDRKVEDTAHTIDMHAGKVRMVYKFISLTDLRTRRKTGAI